MLNNASAVTDFIQYENVIKVQQGAAVTSRSLNQFIFSLLGKVERKVGLALGRVEFIRLSK